MKETKLIPISATKPEQSLIESAVDTLRAGGIVAFPTETVYGLGADALNPTAVADVFRAKGRPADNPLIVHICSIEQIYELGEHISTTARTLAETFMPGPLTLIVKHSPLVHRLVTAGLDTVALRMPNHPVPLALVKTLGRGIVGPSANLSGKPSPTMAQHVYDDLCGIIEMILDAGSTTIGVESTVVDTSSEPPVILRPGGITKEQLESVIGTVRTSNDIDQLKRSPGTRHRHYAPRAKVYLIEPGNTFEMLERWNEAVAKQLRVRALIYSAEMQSLSALQADLLPQTTEGYSHQLFSELRRLDGEGIEVILIEAVRETGLGVAVMDRLRRAAEATGKQ